MRSKLGGGVHFKTGIIHSAQLIYPSWIFKPECLDLKSTVWLVLLILGCPEQLDLDMELPVWFEVDPDLVERLLRLADQVGEREFAVGDEIIRRNGGAAQHHRF